MCIADWRIGRLIRSIGYDKPAGASLILPKNMQRVGLIISMDQSGAGPGLDAMFAQTTGGLAAQFWNDGSNPYLISMATHGNIPTFGWSIGTEAGLSRFNAVELIMPEEYLEAALESFKSEYSQWLKSSFP